MGSLFAVAGGALFNALLGRGVVHDAVHIDAWQVDVVRCQLTGGHNALHLDHANLAGGGGCGVEVACGHVEAQVA